MAEFTRANAWNNGGTFDNPDLLWYAKGVGAMQARQLSDSSSWWFFAAIHGEYVSQAGFPGWGSLPAPPAVPTSPLPSQSDQDQYWDQCQHQTWYFLPWHRGYLLALEAQIRAEVITLGGPATWALPYWNYFGPDPEANIPPAFTQQALPDGTPNPLFVTARYGPSGNGDIFVPIPPVSQASMANDLFTGDDTVTPPPGFGGPDTGFSHGGGEPPFGNLESDPHNPVHVFVGGNAPDGETYGLMSDPGLAGLDPIFYFHHANIDRLWAVWNANPSNLNSTDPNWLNGPPAVGEREFVMPWPGGSPWVYTPQEMNSLDQVNYTYDDLPAAAAAPAATVLAQRLTRLGAPAAAARAQEGAVVTSAKNVELLGANPGPLAITSAGARTTVQLDTDVRRKVSASLASAAVTAQPDRVFLNLENVRGTHDASVLSVYINLPEGANPSDHPELLAGTVALFGLRRASLQDGQHGGQGLHFVLEITKIVDALHLDHALDADSLQVRIVSLQPVPDRAEITVGRISVYRKGQ
jgi:tyrosinase